MSELKKKNYANGLIRKKQIYFGKVENYEKTFNKTDFHSLGACVVDAYLLLVRIC